METTMTTAETNELKDAIKYFDLNHPPESLGIIEGLAGTIRMSAIAAESDALVNITDETELRRWGMINEH